MLLLSQKIGQSIVKSIKHKILRKLFYSLTLMAVIVLHDDLGELSPINCFELRNLLTSTFYVVVFNSFIHSINIFN